MFENSARFIKYITLLAYTFGPLEYEFLAENELKFMTHTYMGSCNMAMKFDLPITG